MKKQKNRISVHLPSKDRPTELALCLQSLRTQTYQNFDVVILDDCSGQSPLNYAFMSPILNMLKHEGHAVVWLRKDIPGTVCTARQFLVDNDPFKNNELILRLDDDVMCDPDYLEKLIQVIDAGYDLASGVTPPAAGYPTTRRTRFVKPIINAVEFDNEGNITKNGDDCGYTYVEDEIIPTHHFRSCALYKKNIHKTIEYEKTITFFREEQFLSFRAILAGFKLGVHTGAVVRHLMPGSGGNKSFNYQECVRNDDAIFVKWAKDLYTKHGNFLEVYDKEVLQ